MGFTEEDEALLRKRIRESQERTEALGRELDLLLESRQTGSDRKRGTLFYVHVITDDVPGVINPRDTIGAHLFGRKYSDFCFWTIYKNQQLGLLFSFVSGFCPILFWLLSISVEPKFGWAVGLAIPFPVISFSLYNRKLIYRILTSFEWWAVFALLCISVGTMIDAFAVDPPRTFGACCFLCAFGVGTLNDARPLFRNTSMPAKVLYISWACVFWASLFLWWLNKWILVRETVIPLGSAITVNVQSIGFSCFSSLTVLFTRYAWIVVHDRGGTMIVIKARVQYCPLDTSPSSRLIAEKKVVASVSQPIGESDI